MRIENDGAYQFNDSIYKPFEKSCDDGYLISIDFKKCSKPFSLPNDFLNINTTKIYFDELKRQFIVWDESMLTFDKSACQSWMTVNKDWSKATIHSVFPKLSVYAESNYIKIVFSSFTASYNVFFMHGAIVEYNGQAVVFTASSGVGKSTHADLWKKAFNATIVNGDCTAIRIIDSVIYACGTPWSGSSPYALNRMVPLKAIVVLEQATENKIKKLNVIEALQYFATHCYYPIWDKKATALYMDKLDEVIKKIPIYLLQCRPDEEAAVLARDAIFAQRVDFTEQFKNIRSQGS